MHSTVFLNFIPWGFLFCFQTFHLLIFSESRFACSSVLPTSSSTSLMISHSFSWLFLPSSLMLLIFFCRPWTGFICLFVSFHRSLIILTRNIWKSSLSALATQVSSVVEGLGAFGRVSVACFPRVPDTSLLHLCIYWFGKLFWDWEVYYLSVEQLTLEGAIPQDN